MSERGHFRGGGRSAGRSAKGDTSNRGGRASTGGTRGGTTNSQQQERPKKENILDLAKYMDKQVSVKFNGGRQGLSI